MSMSIKNYINEEAVSTNEVITGLINNITYKELTNAVFIYTYERAVINRLIDNNLILSRKYGSYYITYMYDVNDIYKLTEEIANITNSKYKVHTKEELLTEPCPLIAWVPF